MTNLHQLGFFHKRSHNNPVEKLRELIQFANSSLNLNRPLIVLPEAIDGKAGYPDETAKPGTQETTRKFQEQLLSVAKDFSVFLLTGLYAWSGRVGLSSAYMLEPDGTCELVHVKERVLQSANVNSRRYRVKNPIQLKQSSTRIACLICLDCDDPQLRQRFSSNNTDILAIPAASRQMSMSSVAENLPMEIWVVFANSLDTSWIRDLNRNVKCCCADNIDRLVICDMNTSEITCFPR